MKIDHRSASRCLDMSRRCRYGPSNSLDTHGHSRIGSFRLWLLSKSHRDSLALNFPSCWSSEACTSRPKTCSSPFPSNFLVRGKRSKDFSTRWCTQYLSASLVVRMLTDTAPVVTFCKNTREMSLPHQAPLEPEACTRGRYCLR